MTFNQAAYPFELGNLMASFRNEVAVLMRGLKNGDVKPTDWKKEMARLLAKNGQAARLLGTGRDKLDEQDQLKSRRWLLTQLQYLDNFALVIESNMPESKEYNPAWESRANMYASSTVTEYWEGATEDLPLPAQPGQGTQCLGNCKCSWEIVWLNRDRGDADCYWKLGVAEHCQTCEVRAEMWNPIRIRGGMLLGDMLGPSPTKPSPEELEKILRSVEDELADLDKERVVVMDEKGNRVIDVAGSENITAIDKKDIPKFQKAIVLHNHPSGSAPSMQDISALHGTKARELRVITKGKVYTVYPVEYQHSLNGPIVTDFPMMFEIEPFRAGAVRLWNYINAHQLKIPDRGEFILEQVAKRLGFRYEIRNRE